MDRCLWIKKHRLNIGLAIGKKIFAKDEKVQLDKNIVFVLIREAFAIANRVENTTYNSIL